MATLQTRLAWLEFMVREAIGLDAWGRASHWFALWSFQNHQIKAIHQVNYHIQTFPDILCRDTAFRRLQSGTCITQSTYCSHIEPQFQYRNYRDQAMHYHLIWTLSNEQGCKALRRTERFSVITLEVNLWPLVYSLKYCVKHDVNTISGPRASINSLTRKLSCD